MVSLLLILSDVHKVPGSGLSPPPGSPPHCLSRYQRVFAGPKWGQQQGRRAERTVVGSRSLGRGEEVGGCRGEEWPHAQGILREEQGCQEGPPWVWLSVSLRTGCCPAALVRGAPALSFSSSSSPTPSCSESDPGSQTGRAGTAGCWQPPALTPLPASLPPLLWGKGCRAASDWPS